MKAEEYTALIVAVIAFIGTLITAIITIRGVNKTVKASRESAEKSNEISIILGEMSDATQGKQRLIETVSIQRVAWINNIRDLFSQFTKLTAILADKRANEQKIGDVKFEFFYLVNHIELFLNPTEIITKRFIQLKDKVSSYLLNDLEFFSLEEYSELMLDLHFIEQVILKSEWKRLKEETKNGYEIDNMEEIHKKTAKAIDSRRYKRLLENDFKNI